MSSINHPLLCANHYGETNNNNNNNNNNMSVMDLSYLGGRQ